MRQPSFSVLLEYCSLVGRPDHSVEIVIGIQEPDGDLIASRRQRIAEDPVLVVEDEADDPVPLCFIPLRVQHLVQRAEARVDAPAQDGLFQGRISFNDFMPHLVRHLQKIKLARREAAVDDGVHVVHVVIF